MTKGAQLLRAWLDRSRVKAAHFAKDIGVSKPFLSNVLKGYRRPKLETLIVIEGRTGVPAVSWAETLVSAPVKPSSRTMKTSKVRKGLTKVA